MDPHALTMVFDLCAMPNNVNDNICYIDFGATHYFTPDLAMMQSAIPFTGSDQVIIGDGKTLSVSHIRHTSVSTTLFLHLYKISIMLLIFLIISLVFLNSFMIIRCLLNFMVAIFLSNINSLIRFYFRGNLIEGSRNFLSHYPHNLFLVHHLSPLSSHSSKRSSHLAHKI